MTEKEVILSFSLKQAEKIRDGLADVLCWHRGFKAASKDMDDDTDPMGVWALRDMSIELRRSINIALGDKE